MSPYCIKCYDESLHPFHDDGTVNEWWEVGIPIGDLFDEPVLSNVMVRYDAETDRIMVATTRFVVVPVARSLWENADNDDWLKQAIADGFNDNPVMPEDIVLRDE